jgi:cytokinin riboside 5'-monophosphate phosphoribohydrolase
MSKIICVYSSSSCTVDDMYFEAAARLGQGIAMNGDTLLYGGGLIGLMGASAKAAHQYGGKVIGVIPEALNLKGVVYESCDKLIVTKDIRERKATMDSTSDAFVALPGGFGTLEEILEIISLKLLRYHNKPIVILNVNGFYDKLLEQFENIIAGRFAKEECRKLYFVSNNVEDVLSYIHSYVPPVFSDKWLTNVEKE